MKEFTLSIVERLKIISIFNDFLTKGKGVNMETLGALAEDVKTVALSESEKAEIGFREEQTTLPDGQVATTSKWDSSIDKTLILNEKTIAYLLRVIDDKDKAEEMTFTDIPLIELRKKLTA